MAQIVTRTCTMIVYAVKVYNENTDKVFTLDISIDESEKPSKAIPELLGPQETMIKAVPVKKVEELRKMTSRYYYEHSELVSSKIIPL